MSRQFSPAASRRSGARDVGVLQASRSAPALKGQLDRMGVSGGAKSQFLGTVAKTMGAKITSTLHHRGEHEVGAVVDPNDDHVYVPRAMWTQSSDHTLKASNGQWNQQTFVAEELKRLHGEEKKKEYLIRAADTKMKEKDENRAKLRKEKDDFAAVVDTDAKRHMEETGRLKSDSKKGNSSWVSGLAVQRNELARRAQEGRAREHHEANEIKMRTVQQLCEESAAENRKKKQILQDCKLGMQGTQAKKDRARLEKQADHDKAKVEAHEALMYDEYRAQAVKVRCAERQDHQDACVRVYDRTAGIAGRAKESAEILRIDNDEKKHLMRTDAYYAEREGARERQRQDFVEALDKHVEMNHHAGNSDRLAKKAERLAMDVTSKKALEEELAKKSAKKQEELQVQKDLRMMMLAKEEREAKEGNPTKATSLMQMSVVMRRNGNACNTMSNLNKKLDASRYLGKPCGRDEGLDANGTQRVAPLDASPATLRRMIKGTAFENEVPFGSFLAAPGAAPSGGYMSKGTGLAVQDQKLASHWHQGLRPDALAAGRKEARRREAARAEANHD